MMNQRMVHGTTSIFRAILLETTMDLPIVLVTSVQQVTFWSISNSGQLQRLDLALTDGWLFQECCHFALKQWIALRENLQESPIFNGKIHGFRFRFSLKSIQWLKSSSWWFGGVHYLGVQSEAQNMFFTMTIPLNGDTTPLTCYIVAYSWNYTNDSVDEIAELVNITLISLWFYGTYNIS